MPRRRESTNSRGGCSCGRDHTPEDHEVWKASYAEYIALFVDSCIRDEEMDEDELERTYLEHTERLNEWANKLDL